MRRREIIGLIGAAAAWPAVARAQQPERAVRVGALINYAETDPVGKSFVAGFVRRLAALGWIERHNLVIDFRWSGGEVDLLPTYARELVASGPAAILSHTTPATLALKRETQTIPIVFVAISDPIDTGLVESLAHPGGNITGFVNIEAALAGKWLQLLKEVMPRLSRVAMMFNPQTAPFARHYLAPLEKLGSSIEVKVILAPVRSETEIENVITELGREPGTGVICINDIYSFVHRKLINSLMTANKIPGVFFIRTEDSLLSYGVNNADLFERAAGYIDRILRGEKPAELPAQVPTRYILVVNLKTAKELGLELSPSLLTRADEVIE